MLGVRYSPNPEMTIVITEGEFKTLALWRLANDQASGRSRFLPLGLPGLYNGRGTIGKTTSPDADVVSKEAVRIARSELGAHLRPRGWFVGLLEWEITKEKESMITLPSVALKSLSTSSPTLISQPRPLRWNCFD
jgi:hypothetical protein